MTACARARVPSLLAILATLAVLLAAVALVGAHPAAAASARGLGGAQLDHQGIVVGAGASALPDVAAQSWLVADATTGQVLAAKAAHQRHRPASTLKTLTAVTLMPHLDPTAEHRVTARELAPVYGSRAGIVAGADYTVDDLWHALLLPSGNDAAAALAGAYGGVKKTVRAMNAKAAELQARDTTAVNPSGLDADGQYTSAYDLALIARAALGMPEFTRVSGTISYDLPGRAAKPGKKRSTFKIYGQNRLLNDGFRGVVAGKTGYTSLAGRTFWVAATRGGHTVVVTLLGITEPTETAAAKLLTWGLKNAGTVTPVGVLVDPLTAEPVTAPEPGGSASPPAPGTGGHAAGAAGPAAVTGPDTGMTIVVVLVTALVVLALAALLLRARGRRDRRDNTEKPSTAASPADPPAPVAAPAPAAAPTHAPDLPQPDPSGERARPAPVAPTGNVRVVRPPQHDG